MAGHIVRYPSAALPGTVLPLIPNCTVTPAPNGTVLLCLKWRARCGELYDKQRIHPSIEYVGYKGIVG